MKKVISIILITAVLLSCITAAAISANAAVKLAPGYYTVGSFNGWSLDKAYRMQAEGYDRDSDKAEYYILRGVRLSAGDELKVAYTENGFRISAWYPEYGPLTNYVVPEDSYYDIALAVSTEETVGDWEWQLWVEPCEAPVDDGGLVVPEPSVDHTKELWESGAELRAEDIEEAVNAQFPENHTYIFADEITVYDSYRFSCAPAYIVDYEIGGAGVYCCVILEEYFGDYLFYSCSSYEPKVYADNRLYRITDAYKQGILTEEMLAEFVEAGYNGCRCMFWNIYRSIRGDADGDGEVSVIDATVIQRYDARIYGEADFVKPLGDVDGDKEITVIDATLIQRKEAGMYTIG